MKCGQNAGRGSQRLSRLLLLTLLVVLVQAGCTKSRPTLGAISVTGASGGGQVSSVIVANTVNVSVTVNGDSNGLGVDWHLLCGGSAVPGFVTNVCGTITPLHVGSNINMVYLAPQYVPVGNTVTLSADATSDPSRSVSVTLTILPTPATIQFTQGFLPPAAMAAGGTAQIAATVTNDPTYAGVNWTATCSVSPCGSFSPTTTASGGAEAFTVYTAPTAIPSAGSVSITASSVYSSKTAVSATVSIMPISVALAISPNPVPDGSTATLTATVSWDGLNQGVNWGTPTCSGPQCGTVTPGTCSASGSNTALCTAVYTSPALALAAGSSLQVSETATSVTDTTKSGSVTFTVAPAPPISVSVTATPGAVQVGGATTLAAVVSNDFSNSGVSWQCVPACALSSTTTPSSTTGNTATYSVSFTPPNDIPTGQASAPIAVTATSIAAPTTDPTASGSTTLTQYQPISVTLNTQPVTVGTPATFSATVTNDIPPGGLDWTATGCGSANCGTFSSGDPNAPNHTASGANITYNAPNIRWPGTNPTVTITATSTASATIPPSQSASAQVPVTPGVFVEFVPVAPSVLAVGSSTAATPTLINLTAAVANDSTHQGVDWTVTCSDASVASCGQFLKTPEMVATPTTPDVSASFWPYGSKVHVASGQSVVYEPPTQTPTAGTLTLTATSTASPGAAATQTVTITSTPSGPALSGTVRAGTVPVSGATVQLFAAGNTGYGSASTPLVISNGGSSVTTGSDGSFAIPAGFTCPSINTLLYLVATGGHPGGPQGPVNPQLGLMTAVGPCSDLDGSTPLVVNEVTTVASVYALAPFIGADYAHIGSSASNYNNGPNPSNATNSNNGLANAFQTVNNLVDITQGQALANTPAGTGTVPQAEINTLADAIDTCAVTAGGTPGDGSACDAFFEASNVNPANGAVSTSANAPTSILQAIIEVAQVPSTNRLTNSQSGTPLYDIVSSPSFTPPFTPILTAVPYDWSIVVTYTGGGLEGKLAARPLSSALALDAAGNLWIANKNASSISEFSNAGAALSPYSTGTTAGSGGGFKGGGLTSPIKVGVDPFGEVWALNGNSSLSELAADGSPISSATGYSGGANASDNGAGLALDGNGNAWVIGSGTPGDLAEYAGYNGGTVNGTPVAPGGALSPAGVGYVNGINSPNGVIAVDGSNNIWVLNVGNYAAVKLSSTNGQLLDTDQGDLVDPQSGLPQNPPQYLLSSTTFGTSMAIDQAGDIFIPSSLNGQTGAIYELLAGGSSSNFGGIGQPLNLTIAPTYAPVAIDGGGRIWQVVEPNVYAPTVEPLALAELSSSGATLNSNAAAQGFVSSSVVTTGLSTVGVDASGNVWVLSGFNPSTVTEFVGVAAPVITPTSLAVQKNKLGSKP